MRGGFDLAHVGFALDAGRSADADERELGCLQALDIVEREPQATGFDVLDDDFFQPRLVNRQLTPAKSFHLAGSMSMPMTWLPSSAKQAAVTSPT